MKNFVFISPNYPENYWMFCRGLKKHGARVLGIIDSDYDSLNPQLKEAMDDCYKVDSFHNYDQMYRAVAYFAFKYGRIDWIESNNEAWLALDAKLREDFNVKSGFSLDKILEFQSKSAMKKYYEKAGIKTAPYVLPRTFEEADEFGKRHDYQMVLKPDHGVGASSTWHIQSREDLKKFWNQAMELETQMILEAFVDGDVITLDGLADENGTIRFLSSMSYVSNCMYSVQNHDSIGTYIEMEIPPEYRKMAQKVVSAFGIKNRFFHGEYFVLRKDDPDMGKKGDLCALEMNFRAPGGFCPDLINYSYNTDVYELWAQVLMEQTCPVLSTPPYSAGFVGRRSEVAYETGLEMLIDKYRDELLGIELLPPAFASAMGDVTIKVRFQTPERRQEFFKDAFERKRDAS